MSEVVIKQITVAEFENDPNFSGLLAEYADELAIDGLPHPSAKIEMYKQLESMGSFQIIAAYLDNLLIGFINVLMVMNPHYGISIAVSESYFVAKEYRKTGAGLKLRHAAENHAKQLHSPGFFISAPFGGPLAEALAYSDEYIETGRTFFRKFDNA